MNCTGLYRHASQTQGVKGVIYWFHSPATVVVMRSIPYEPAFQHLSVMILHKTKRGEQATSYKVESYQSKTVR